MKPNLYHSALFVLVSLLLITNPVWSQSDSTGKKQKKGSGFLKALNKTFEVVTGEPLIPDGKDGSPTGSSRSLRGYVIKGEWKKYGAGGDGYYGEANSPRNHHYTFESTQKDAELNVSLATAIATVKIFITGPDGKPYAPIQAGSGVSWYPEFGLRKLTKAGIYHLYVVPNERYATGNYQLTLNGPVSSILQYDMGYYPLDKASFGEEGGSDKIFSARNHQYTFEPEPGFYFDVNIESTGAPLEMVIVDPTGKRFESYKGDDSPGIRYTCGKAELKGIYQIWVCTAHNGKGDYKMEVVGNMKQSQAPVRVPGSYQALQGRFSPASKRHEYTIPARPGNMEVVYRSTSTGARFRVYDAYGKDMSDYTQYGETEQLHEQYIGVQQAGNLKLIVETQQPTVGDYELLVWGHFDPITRKGVPIITPKKPNSGTQPNQPTVETTAPNSGSENVLLTGRIRANLPNLVYTALRVIYEDLETGEKIGEVSPDAAGNYSFSVPPGRRYAIRAVTDDGSLSSSQNVDLTKKTPGRSQMHISDITIITADVPATINLNNIFFLSGKATLLPQSYAELNRIGKFLKDHPTVQIEIAGHTDGQGSPQVNKVLSYDRALSVAYNLQGQQVSPTRVKAVGYGPAKPVATNTTDAGRTQNRRVEFRIVSR